jgi:hypothetical protein
LAAPPELAEEYKSAVCRLFETGWRALRAQPEMCGVGVLIVEGVLCRSGRYGAHRLDGGEVDSHCMLIITGLEAGVVHLYEPFLIGAKWKSLRDIRPSAVGVLLSAHTKTSSVKLVCGMNPPDLMCRRHCFAFLDVLARTLADGGTLNARPLTR